MLRSDQSTPLTISTPATTRSYTLSAMPRRSYFMLLALTVFAAITRFAFLNRPGIWFDESMTFARTCGTWQELLVMLRDRGGFGPLHYEFYWVLGRYVRMTPVMMRFLPALAGTAMVPAMYYLSRQLTGRKTALLTAAFTACSAYMMVYSSDAKMYSHFWLACVLSAACFLRWVKTNFRLHWLLWIMSSLAMTGLHAPGFIVLGIQALMLVSYEATMYRGWKPALNRVLIYLAGLVLIVIAPITFYLTANHFVSDISDHGWRASQLQWIDPYNYGRTGTDLIQYTSTAFLFSWEWPKTQAMFNAIDPRVSAAAMAFSVTMLALLIVGVFPWKVHRVRPLVDMNVPPEPWWRGTLWIAAWLVLPAYGFYCISYARPAPPWDWRLLIDSIVTQRWHPPLKDVRAEQWAMLSVEIGLLTLLCAVWRGAARALALALPGYLIATLIMALSKDGVSDPAATFMRWLPTLNDPRLYAAAIAILPPAVWFYSSLTTTGRVLKTGQFLAVAGVIILLCCGIYSGIRFFTKYQIVVGWKPVWYGWQAPISLHIPVRTGSQIWDFHSLWMPRYLGIAWPAFAIAVAALIIRLPNKPLRWIAIAALLSANLVNAAARIYIDPEPPLHLAVADLVADKNHTGPHTYITGGSGFSFGVHPGTAWFGTPVAQYYYAVYTGEKPHPNELMSFFFGRRNDLPMRPFNWFMINRDAATDQTTPQAIVWDRIISGSTFAQVPPAMGWEEKSSQTFPTFDHWTWEKEWIYRRRVFEKIPPSPPNAPSTARASTTRKSSS